MGTRKVRIKKKPLAQARNGAESGVNNGFDIYRQGNSKDTGLNQFGKERVDVNRSLKPVPREKANLEAERGEQVIVPGSGGIPETYTVGGNRHAAGGTPLSLQAGAFVFSDHKKGMKINDPEILAEFGLQVSAKNKKGYTPAAIAKRFDVNPYLKILLNPDSDDMDRESSELMITKYVAQLGKLGLLQESMKGFPQGIPDISKPYLESVGIDPQELVAQEGGEQGRERQPQEQMMRFGGNYSNLNKFIGGGEEMAMMQQQGAPQGPPQGPPQQGPPQGEPQGGQDPMAQLLQQVTQALEQGADPQEIVAQLLQGDVPPEVIIEVLSQIGMPQEEVQQLVMAVTQQMQGAQEQGAPGQQAPVPEEMMAMQQQTGPPQEEMMMRAGGNINKQQATRFPGLDIANKADGGGTFEAHSMFDPRTKEEYPANSYEEHLRMQEQGFLHENEMAYGGQQGYGALKFGRDGLQLAQRGLTQDQLLLAELQKRGAVGDTLTYGKDIIDVTKGKYKSYDQSNVTPRYNNRTASQILLERSPYKLDSTVNVPGVIDMAIGYVGPKPIIIPKSSANKTAAEDFNKAHARYKQKGKEVYPRYIPKQKDGGGLDKFLPTAQDGSQYDDMFVSPRVQAKLDREANKQAGREDRAANKATRLDFKKNEGALKGEYQAWLSSKGWKKSDYQFDEWLQNEAMNNDNTLAGEVYEGRRQTIPQVANRAAASAKGVVSDLRDGVQNRSAGSEKIVFDDPSVWKGEDITDDYRIPGLTIDGAEKPTAGGGTPKSSKAVKSQNVSNNKIASTKEGTKNSDTPYYRGDNGVVYKVAWDEKETGVSKYKGEELSSVFNGNQDYANKYQYLQDTFVDDPIMKKKLADSIRNSAKNKQNYLSSGQNPGDNLKGKGKAYYDEFSVSAEDMSDDELVGSFMDSQHRNLGLAAHRIDPNDFEQNGNIKSGSKTARENPNIKNIYQGYKKSGVEVGDLQGTNSHNIAFEQLGYHGYVDLLGDRESLPQDQQDKLKHFSTNITGTGVADEKGVGKEGSRVSPIDGYGTNTTAGHVSWTDGQSDWTATETEADWQEDSESPYVNDFRKFQRDPARWWAQDIGNMGNLFGQRMGIKKYLPLDGSANFKKPDALYYDPTRALAANAEQAAIAQQSLAAYGSPSSGTYRAGDISGKGLEQAANILSQYEDKNVGIGNQYMASVADISNKETAFNAQAREKFHAGWTTANQQYDNSNRQTGRNLFEGWRQGLSNKYQTDTLNQMYPQWAVNPAVGGRLDFTNGRPLINQGNSGSAPSNSYLANLDNLKSTYGDKFTAKEYEEAAKRMGSGAGYSGGAGAGYYGGQRRGSPIVGGDQFYNQYANQIQQSGRSPDGFGGYVSQEQAAEMRRQGIQT